MLFNKSFLLLLVLYSGFYRPVNKSYLKKWVISKGCSLQVNGSTTINKFSCVISNYYKPDTLTLYQDDEAGSLKFAGKMELDVQSFDCHNPMMTANLRKTLKGKVFPKLIIKFISLSRYPDGNDDGGDAIKGAVTIQLAGIKEHFNVNYKITSERTNSLTMVGTRQVKFSDFNLILPKKFGNLIQAKD